ncbi:MULTISPECIES: hypothetical protein [unclassified Meiothermus]|uniref:sunset domain-containing protein n=1 Tax=unclassified Meiothermus TaxID=370471 RepID=UPI00157F819D|nr:MULTISPECIES: hypothetical protein [unclassified Meiothermus]
MPKARFSDRHRARFSDRHVARFWILGVLLGIAAAQATPPLLPDAAKTPGDVLTTDASLVCQKGYSASVRNVPPALKQQVFALYGLTKAPGQDWEVDHLISLELGGSNSVRNLWPQAGFITPWNYHVKDRLENALHYLVCRGELPLSVAQHAIAKNWIEAFKAVCGDAAEGCAAFRFGARYPEAFHLTPEAKQRLFALGQDAPPPPAYTPQSARPNPDGSCPAEAPIKGSKARVYHPPSDPYYAATRAVACFPSEEAARSAGYRPSRGR